MAKTHETIADIIAWLRRPIEGENAYLTLWRDEIAARIEVALRRERGDAAKLREALALIATIEYPHNFQRERFDIADACQDLTNAIDTACTALAAPPRNCDRFKTAAEAIDAYQDLTGDQLATDSGMKEWVEFAVWLFAPATEKEGGAK